MLWTRCNRASSTHNGAPRLSASDLTAAVGCRLTCRLDRPSSHCPTSPSQAAAILLHKEEEGEEEEEILHLRTKCPPKNGIAHRYGKQYHVKCREQCVAAEYIAYQSPMANPGPGTVIPLTSHGQKEGTNALWELSSLVKMPRIETPRSQLPGSIPLRDTGWSGQDLPVGRWSTEELAHTRL